MFTVPVGGVTLLHQIKRAFRLRNSPGTGMDKDKAKTNDVDKDKGRGKGRGRGRGQDSCSVKGQDGDNSDSLPSVVLIVGDCVISEGQ